MNDERPQLNVCEYDAPRAAMPTLTLRIGRAFAISAFVLMAPVALATLCLNLPIPLPAYYLGMVFPTAGFTGIICSLVGYLLGPRWSLWALPSYLLLAMLTPTICT